MHLQRILGLTSEVGLDALGTPRRDVGNRLSAVGLNTHNNRVAQILQLGLLCDALLDRFHTAILELICLVCLGNIRIGCLLALERVVVNHNVVIEVEILAHAIGTEAEYSLVLAIGSACDEVVVEAPLLDVSPPKGIASLHRVDWHYAFCCAVNSVLLVEVAIHTSCAHPVALVALLCLHKRRDDLHCPHCICNMLLRNGEAQALAMLGELVVASYNLILSIRDGLCRVLGWLSVEETHLDALCVER